jgi:hypothetical protein
LAAAHVETARLDSSAMRRTMPFSGAWEWVCAAIWGFQTWL